MNNLRRMAAIVTPKVAFFAWPKLVLGMKPDDRKPDDFRTVFLLPQRDDIERALESAYRDIFAEMTQSWINEPELWPTPDSLESFHKWFEVETVRIVVDVAPSVASVRWIAAWR